MKQVLVLAALAVFVAVAYGFRYEIKMETKDGFIPHVALLHAEVEKHNVSINDFYVHPRTIYSKVLDIGVPAPKIKNAALTYFNYNPYMNITVKSFEVVPLYLSEPYRTQLTKRFPVPSSFVFAGRYNMTV